MAVPTAISELSTTPGSNPPSGSDSPSVLDNHIRTVYAFIRSVSDLSALPGDVKWQAHSTVAAGWLACDGSAVSRATYAALFAVIGTTWGAGDGTTTFNLPDSRNRALVGSGGLYAIGATGGSKDAVVVSHTHTATVGNQSADHTHSGTTNTTGAHNHTAATNIGGTFTSAGATGAGGNPTSTNGDHSHTITTGVQSANHNHTVTNSTEGVSGTNANLPPYAAMLACIKF